MSTSHSGFSFPGAGGDAGMMAPASSSTGSSRVICPGEGAQWPPLDSHLVTPETREEMVDGVRLETMASDPPHGDSHFDFSAVLSVLLQPGYVGSVDMLTRYAQRDNFAADITIRRAGTNPDTAERYLEELALEIGNTQRRAELEGKAVKMTRRGVRRIFAIMVREQEAYEWDPGVGKLVRVEGEVIADPATLVWPLPVSLVLLIARGAAGRVSTLQVQGAVKNFVAEALDAQGNPVIQRIEQRGEQRGEQRAMVRVLLRALESRGVAVDDVSRRRILACGDLGTLQRWIDRTYTASRIEEVFT